MKTVLMTLAAAMLAAACSAPKPAGVESSSVPPAPTTVVTSTPAAPHSTAPQTDKQTRYIGALNPAVTQAMINQTVCVAGWTKTIRPPVSYTNALKRKQLPAGANLSAYEEDHLMPLELGGAPRDPANLKPIPLARADRDDVWENRLHRELCAGQITLAQAQAKITAVKRAASPAASPSPSPTRTTTAPRPTPRPTVKPTPKPTPKPTVRTTTPRPAVYYANCTAAWNAGAAPLHRGDPGYRPGLDRDGDGIACEDRP